MKKMLILVVAMYAVVMVVGMTVSAKDSTVAADGDGYQAEVVVEG